MDKIYQNKNTGKWFHWDEDERFKYGPFNTYKEAQKSLDEYTEWVNTLAREP